MNNDENNELKELVELSEQFLQFTDDLFEKGLITESKYDEMTKEKIEFLKKVGGEIALN